MQMKNTVRIVGLALVAVSLAGCATLGIKPNYTQSRYVQPISDNEFEPKMLDTSRPSVIYLYDTTAAGYQDMHHALNLSCRYNVMRSVSLNCFSGDLENAGEIGYGFSISQHTALIGLPPLKGLTEEQLDKVAPMVRDGVFTRAMLDDFIAALRSGNGVRRITGGAQYRTFMDKPVVIQLRQLNWERSGDTYDVEAFWAAAKKFPQFHFLEVNNSLFRLEQLTFLDASGAELHVDRNFPVAYVFGTLEPGHNDVRFKVTNARIFYGEYELDGLDKPRSR